MSHQESLPMGIQTKFHPFCNYCPEFEVDQNSSKIMGDNGEIVISTHLITCRHYEKCKHVKRHILDLEKEKSNND